MILKKNTFIMTLFNYYYLIIFIFFSQSLFSQTDTLYKSKNNRSLTASFEGVARHNLISVGYETFNSSISPKVTDNPFVHMAIYSSMNLQYDYQNKYEFNFSLVAEERSASGGNNFLNNIVLFPKITLSVNDTFEILKKKFSVKGRFGDMWNEDWDDRLRIYNIDFQALDLSIKYKTVFFGYSRIADLSNNIGLSLHETAKIYFGRDWNKNHLVVSWEIDNVLTPIFSNNNLSSVYFINSQNKYDFFSQFSVRIKNDFIENNSIAALIGLSYKPNSNLKLTSSLRYYAAEYNLYYKNPSEIKYRDWPNSPYVGLQLYPLKNFYRNMNQWALFTERQNVDIFNLELTIDYYKKIHKSIGLISKLDFNIMRADDQWIALPIYDVGLSLKPIDNIEFRITASNKHMNLDNFYQTFYLSKKPVACLYVAKTI